MIDAWVSAVVEMLFVGTRRRQFGPFGKQPHSAVMLFTGMAFWIMLGIALYKAFRQRSSQPEPAAFPSVALMAQRHGNQSRAEFTRALRPRYTRVTAI